jgi:glutathione synthase/RimK-type ligase-like ATP-grasp enzyme
MIKLAIHHRDNSFSERWIEYCKLNNVNYIIVDCFNTDIIELLLKEKVTHLMWNFHHSSVYDLTVSAYVLNSVELMGMNTFPNFNSRWHFDDKIAQKYLFESLDIPVAQNYVFYSQSETEKFLKHISFPIVGKLKRGAGATNVKLIKSYTEGKHFVDLMFNKGVSSSGSSFGNLDQKIRVIKKVKNPITLIKKLFNYLKKFKKERSIANPEKGYAYFQEFMPNNNYDTRVIVVYDKAIAFKRMNRKDDFRASGSGKSNFNDIDINMIKIAFETSKKLKAQSLAYDFVYNHDKEPVIIEMSYTFGRDISDTAKGYWNENLEFLEKPFKLQFDMIENFLKE